MISYRKSSKVRNAVGAFFFAAAMTLLWVESSQANPESGSMVRLDDEVHEVASIRAATPGSLDRL